MAGPENQVKLSFHVTDDGTLVLLDQAGNKIREIGRVADESGRRAESAFGRVGAAAIGLNQGIELVQRAYRALALPVTAVVTAAAEQEDAVAALNAQLQAQGRYSRALSTALLEQASALQQVTIYADDAVTTAQALLATFPRISNELIPGATAAATDLAAALRTDLPGAAGLLGRALNDPIEGLRGLSRAGIRFTADQKEVIKGLATTGQVAKAQAIILDEVSGRLGGRARAAAETYTGELARLKNGFGDLLEESGNIIVKSDAVREIFGDVRAELIALTGKTAEYVEANRGLIDDKIKGFFSDLPGKIEGAASWMGSLATKTGDWATALKPFIDFATSHPEVALLLLGGRLGGSVGLAAGAGVASGIAINRATEDTPWWDAWPGGWDPEKAIAEALVGKSELTPSSSEINVGPYGDPEVARRAAIAARIRNNRAAIDAMIYEGRFNGGYSSQLGGGQQLYTPAGGAFGDFLFDGTGTQGFADSRNPNPPPITDPEAARKQREAEEKARKDAEKSAEFLTQAAEVRAKIAVGGAQQELEVFQRSREQREALAVTDTQRREIVLAGAAEELRLAQAIDAANARVLDAQIAVTQEKAKAVGLTEGEREFLHAQAAQLEAQKRIIQTTGGEAAKVTDEFVRMAAEAARARQVTVDLADTVQGGLQRAVDGALAGGGDSISDIVSGTGEAIASEFVGGFLKAQLAKQTFDQQIGENFTVTLPGFMQTGADAIGGIWTELMGLLGGSTTEATDKIAGTFSETFSGLLSDSQSTSNGIASYLRSIPGIGQYFSGGAADSTAQIAGAVASEPVRDSFGNIIGYASDASGIGSSALGASGVAGGAGAGAAGGTAAAGGVLGTAAVAAYLGYNLINGLGGSRRAQKAITLDNIITEQDARDESGLFGPGALAAAIAVPIIGQFYAIIAGLITAFVDVPARGTQLKIGLQKQLPETFPRQRDINIGGHSGIRTQFLEGVPTDVELAHFAELGFTPFLARGLGQTIEDVPIARQRLLPGIQAAQAANPGTEALRYGAALGLSAVIGGRPDDAPVLSNAMINNLLLTGASEEDARRELLNVAAKNNVTFDSGLEKLEKQYLNGEFRDDKKTEQREDILQFTADVNGLIDLFQDDLPAGVDATALAVKNFTDKGNIDITNFNKDLDRAKEIFGTLQDTLRGGLRTGLTAALPLAITGDSQKALRDSVAVAAGDGLKTALIEQAYDVVLESPAWRALEEKVASAVSSGISGEDLVAEIDAVVSASVPELVKAAEIMAQIDEALEDATAALRIAQSVEQGLESQFGNRSSALVDEAAKIYALRRQLLEGSGSVNIADLIAQNRRSQQALTSLVMGSVRDGFVLGLETALRDAITNLPAWEQLQGAIKDAITSGDVAALPGLVASAIDQAMPLVQAYAEAMDQANQLFAVTPYALQQQADSLNADAEQRRFGLLTPAQQERKYKEQIAESDRELARLKNDGIDDATQAQEFKQWLDQRATASRGYADVVGQRYDPSTDSGRRANEAAIAEIERTGDLFEAFGITQQDALSATLGNTTATDANTAAVNDNTSAWRELIDLVGPGGLNGGSTRAGASPWPITLPTGTGPQPSGWGIDLLTGGTGATGAGSFIQTAPPAPSALPNLARYESYGIREADAVTTAVPAFERAAAAMERAAQSIERGARREDGDGGTGAVVLVDGESGLPVDNDELARRVSDIIERRRLTSSAIRTLQRQVGAH